VNRVTWGEVRWFLGWSLLAVALSSLPYALAYAVTPPGYQFLGLIPYAADGNTYLAKMMQGAQGEWLYHLAFTPEDHDGALVFTLYLALGRLAAWSGLPQVLVLHAARVFGGLLMLAAAYAAFARFCAHVAIRRVAFLLVCFSGGTGWLFFILGASSWLGEVPVDVHFPDATSFWSLFTFPNYSLSVALMLATVLLYLEACSSRRVGYAVLAGLSGALLALTHPSILVIYVTLAGYVAFLMWVRRAIAWRELAMLAVVVTLSAPVILYEMAVMNLNWAFRVWTEQNYCISPSPLNMLVSFGLTGALAIAGAVHIWRVGRSAAGRSWHGAEERIVPVLWFGIVPILMYVPTSVQRRLLEGWHLPASFLVAIALVRWVVPRLAGKRLTARRALNLTLVASIPSTLLIVLVGVVLVLQTARPLFLGPGELDAINWLRSQTARTDVVLAGMELGNIIPGQTGNRVVFGHWSETLYSEQKSREIVAFFSATASDDVRRQFLDRYDVAVVWYGQEERSLGGFDPGAADYLRAVLTRPDVTLYRVEDP
jgi:hypothetical protein